MIPPRTEPTPDASRACPSCAYGTLAASYERGGQGYWQGAYIVAEDDEYLCVITCTECGTVHGIVAVAMTDVDGEGI